MYGKREEIFRSTLNGKVALVRLKYGKLFCFRKIIQTLDKYDLVTTILTGLLGDMISNCV